MGEADACGWEGWWTHHLRIVVERDLMMPARDGMNPVTGVYRRQRLRAEAPALMGVVKTTFPAPEESFPDEPI